MSAKGKAFEIGGIVVPAHAALGLSQRVEMFGGSARLRLGDGAGLQQTVWRKMRITLSGTGWCPLGVSALNFDAPLTLKCGLPEAVMGGTTTITLPAQRRTDAGYLPFARAHTPAGWVDTPVSISTNAATVTAVAGALGYSVWYYPQISCLVDPPSREFDRAGAASSWELVCEEA